MAGNSNLHSAKNAKNDEFYTQLIDIENELKHYKQHFKDKVVYCNCDDPYESAFFKYFALNFNSLGLKKLITTCYTDSPIQGQELLFPEMQPQNKKTPYKAEIIEVQDMDGNGCIDLDDIKIILKHSKNVCTELKQGGDFHSEECIELLKQADIVVTNPPFSLFREYVAQLVEYNKKFLIIGNKNAITYKEIFPLIKDNQMWLGYTPMGIDMLFDVSDEYAQFLQQNKKQGSSFRIIDGKVKARAQACWFTNLDHSKRHEELILYKQYSPKEYPHYDNYNAIEVSKTAEIPQDWDGVMGVPITFLDKYNPEQFEILGATQRGCHDEVPDTKKYDDYVEMRQDGTPTGSTGGKTNENANLLRNDGKKNYFVNEQGRIIQSAYQRIFIRNKHPQK